MKEKSHKEIKRITAACSTSNVEREVNLEKPSVCHAKNKVECKPVLISIAIIDVKNNYEFH